MSDESDKNGEGLDVELEPESDADMGAGADAAAKVKQLKAKLKECEAKCREYLDGWQRERADFLNFRKDEARRAGEYARAAQAELAIKLIPALDGFDSALADRAVWEKADPTWRQGMENLRKTFTAALAAAGLEPIAETGVPFNLNLHQAVDSLPAESEAQDQLVLEIFQKGYRIGDIIIRPARVKIGIWQKS